MTAAAEKKPLRYSVRGKNTQFFSGEGVDELVSITMALAQELWVVKERLAAFEAVATKKKVFTAKEIEGFKFTPAQRAKLDAESQAFIDRVFFVLRERVEGLAADPDEPPAPKEP
ncbi:MAG: hypothetical protein O3C65_00050 [Proteobacteria bacterium]|nr:hypothetical protein [Pseudomonadota bacterium]MDA1057049.1 hypothetical protein [Pseudomonadota bacterium]